MIYKCIKFNNEYFRIDKIDQMKSMCESYYKVYSDPDEMNCPYGSSFKRAIMKDCILKIEYGSMDCRVCDFYLGNFDDSGVFIPLIYFDEDFRKVIFTFDDESLEFKETWI